MALSDTSKTLISIKKLVGKAHTSNDKDVANESLPSGITLASSTIFAQSIPSTTGSSVQYEVLSNSLGEGVVEFLRLSASFIAGTDTSSGRHGYAISLPDDYQTNSKNPRKGTYPFINRQDIFITSGSLQLIPPSFDSNYEAAVYQTGSGQERIPVLDARDWSLDYFNGVFFQQDPPGTGDHSESPRYIDAYLYIGKFSDSGLFSSGLSGSLTQLTDGSSYIAAGTNITIASSSNGQITISAEAGSSPGGSNTQVQFNDGGSLGGDSGLVFNKTSNTLTANNISGSLTRLSDGTSYIIAGNSISITSQSNGSILISAPNNVFNEYVGAANGTNTRFSLDHTPTANKNVSVFVNGQLQMPATNITSAPFQDYSVTGSVIFFTSGSIPDTGSVLLANYTTNQVVT